MTGATKQMNPYIVGPPISDPKLFFGREGLFRFVQDRLRQGVQVIILHGQRRIGKSSVLFQMPNFVGGDEFAFVLFDLHDKSLLPLSTVLHGLAQKIVADLKLEAVTLPSVAELEKEPSLFSLEFLPQVYRALPDKKLVLLLDEFDVLNNYDPAASVDHLFPYLESLRKSHERLFLIPVVGRQVNELDKLLSLFREAPYEKIGLLKREGAEQLITQPAKDNLEYDSDAIQAILELSSGHPYITPAICSEVFDQAQSEGNRKVTRAVVESIVEEAISIAEGGLAWFREGLPIPERVVFSAVAEAQKIAARNGDLVVGEPLTLLKEYGMVETDALIQAVKGLVAWDFIDEVENTELSQAKVPSYKVTVELVRRWLVKRYPLRREIWELDNFSSEANQIYEVASELRQNPARRRNALTLYEQVLAVNPNHFKALFEMAEGYLEVEDFGKAVEFYERAYRVDPIRSEDGLVRSHLSYGDELITQGEFELARQHFQQVLDIEPDNVLVPDKLQEIKANQVLLGGRYRPIKILSKGGFKNVYLAEYCAARTLRDRANSTNPLCVVKQVTPDNTSIEFREIRRLFEREAEILAKLGKHPQIPQLIDYFEQNGGFFIIEEFIEGHSLTEELMEPLPEEQVLNILESVLEILKFIHEQNIVHRDIKPSNIIRRDRDHKLVLLDFGAIEEIQKHSNSIYQTTTTVIATPAYMPLEQLSGFPRLSSDIYSVGMIGIQAITGIYPIDLPRDIYTNEIKWMDKAKVSPDLGDILTKMVKYDFRERYQSALQDVKALKENLKIVVSPAPPDSKSKTLLQLVRYLISTITAFSKPVLKRICSHQHQSKFN